jgi:hypothetical protein
LRLSKRMNTHSRKQANLKTNSMKTKVKFLIDKDGDAKDVFAFFPELAEWDRERLLRLDASQATKNQLAKLFICYSHIGQHSSCHVEYANECQEAAINEYWDLLRELIGQGYKDLEIVNSHLITCHRQPTKAEIKRGYGAIHYRDFTLSEIGLKKGRPMWKNWFIASDDGLRYYTS